MSFARPVRLLRLPHVVWQWAARPVALPIHVHLARALRLAARRRLAKLMADIKQASDRQAKMLPNSPDFKKLDDEVTRLKAQYEASRAQAQRDFTA